MSRLRPAKRRRANARAIGIAKRTLIKAERNACQIVKRSAAVSAAPKLHRPSAARTTARDVAAIIAGTAIAAAIPVQPASLSG